jgi:indole-3-glycerol phosphate synthase
LQSLVEDALANVESGYYDNDKISLLFSTYEGKTIAKRSLVGAIRKNPWGGIISEIKFSSPSAGDIAGEKWQRSKDVSRIARDMERGGASGISVLTEPSHFSGSLGNLIEAKRSTSLPVIMKDIIVSSKQVDAAQRIGADAILFIEEVFSRKYVKHNNNNNFTLQEATKLAKESGLEVIVETHSTRGLKDLILENDIDIIGINNRDLETFDVNIETTTALLEDLLLPPPAPRSIDELRRGGGRLPVIMSESGFENPSDIKRVRKELSCGRNGNPEYLPHAFLIGTSIMKSDNIPQKVAEFVEALKTT